MSGVRVVDLTTEDVTSRPGRLAQVNDWTEVWQTQMKPEWRGGLLDIQGQIADSDVNAALYQYATIEFRVVGYTGSSANVLRRGVLGGDAGGVVHVLRPDEQYNRVAVEARKLIDGAIGSTIEPAEMLISVVGRMRRGG